MASATEKEPKEKKKERRKMSIIDIARKSGVLLGNGEYWDGKERRALREKERGEKEKDEGGRKKRKKPPPSFFG
ncbi:MAG: hypothetical protein ACNS63_07030 [Candidatus Nitrospinota bacterium M3_3B_026]